MNPILMQLINNIFILVIAILIVSLLEKGFFFPYIRVRTSFGRLIMVKIRAVNRDYFKVGWIDEGFLVYNVKKGRKRISVKDSSFFYRALSVTWIDVDESKNAVCKPDYSIVDGFDAEKYDNLFKRTLYRPSVSDYKDKIIFTLIIVAIIAAAASAYVGYMNMTRLDAMRIVVDSIKSGFAVPT